MSVPPLVLHDPQIAWATRGLILNMHTGDSMSDSPFSVDYEHGQYYAKTQNSFSLVTTEVIEGQLSATQVV